MGERYTKKDAEACFKRLANFFGKETDCWEKKDDTYVSKVGCWKLSYNPTYGGCLIEEIANEDGATDPVFTYRRYPPNEFCEMTRIIEKAIKYWEKNKKK